VLLSIAAFQNPLVGFVSMVGFWLGTVPAMSVAPEVVRRVFAPLFKRKPKLSSFVLVFIGLFIVTLRVMEFYQQSQLGESCH